MACSGLGTLTVMSTEPRELIPDARDLAVDAMHAGVAVSARAVEAAKPKLRGWLHAVTSPLAMACGAVLIALAPTGIATVGATVFTITSVLLFTTSAIYHRGHWSPVWEQRLKRLDHANIFLLIAGSYTPFGLLALTGSTRSLMLSIVWGVAVLGVVFRVLWVGAPRWLYVPMYIGLGWAAAFVFPQLLHGAGVPAFVLVAIGGGLYTLGGLVYALKRPDPLPRWFGFHEIFHVLTVAAFTCQYIAASLVVYRTG
jgi:hemolysin III